MPETSLATQLGEWLPHVNAGLNSTCAVLLVAGRLAIARRRIDAHRRLMVAAFVVSVVFLICYLTRFALTGTHRYAHGGALKVVYLVILSSHMTLAAVTPWLAIRAIWLGYRARLAEHRRIVRVAFPIWLYVSVTGVIVYAMLYHT